MSYKFSDDELTHNPFAEANDSSYANLPLENEEAETKIICSDKGGSIIISSDSENQRQRADSFASVKLVNKTLAERPKLDLNIKLEDPVTVGEGFKSYTVYKVSTSTCLSIFKSSKFSTMRRFKEFLWIYQTLTISYPGIIVPPIPEKQSIGRFDSNFVENRRVLLERMVQKIAAHPVLHKDKDFINFLQSENLQVDMVMKKENSKSSFMSKLGDVFIPKAVEIDEYFENKKLYVDNLESQLKAIGKAIDVVIKQREEMVSISGEFIESLNSLSAAEISKGFSRELIKFSEINGEVKKVYEKQAFDDLFYISNTIDEYYRITGSIKNAFNSRSRIFNNYQAAVQNLGKLKINLEKLKMAPKLRFDKIDTTEKEIADAENKVFQMKTAFEEVSDILKKELDQFEKEKMNDIKSSLEGYLVAIIDNQRQIVSFWKSYHDC